MHSEPGAQKVDLQVQNGIYKTHMSPTIRTEAHARKMKVISAGTTFMGKYHDLLSWFAIA